MTTERVDWRVPMGDDQLTAEDQASYYALQLALRLVRAPAIAERDESVR
jgi:hypothetical protein